MNSTEEMETMHYEHKQNTKPLKEIEDATVRVKAVLTEGDHQISLLRSKDINKVLEDVTQKHKSIANRDRLTLLNNAHSTAVDNEEK